MTHDEARTHVRNHTQRSGNKHNITITPKMVMRWWNVLNVAVFYGRLHRPTSIEVSNLRGYWAECVGEQFAKGEIKRSRLRFKETFTTKRMFLDILIHEMVHMWEYQHHTKMGHRKRFLIWKSRIKRTVNLDLDIEINDKEYLQ